MSYCGKGRFAWRVMSCAECRRAGTWRPLCLELDVRRVDLAGLDAGNPQQGQRTIVSRRDQDAERLARVAVHGGIGDSRGACLRGFEVPEPAACRQREPACSWVGRRFAAVVLAGHQELPMGWGALSLCTGAEEKAQNYEAGAQGCGEEDSGGRSTWTWCRLLSIRSRHRRRGPRKSTAATERPVNLEERGRPLETRSRHSVGGLVAPRTAPMGQHTAAQSAGCNCGMARWPHVASSSPRHQGA